MCVAVGEIDDDSPVSDSWEVSVGVSLYVLPF